MEPDAQPQQLARPNASGKLWTRSFITGTLTNFVLLVNYYMLMVVMTSYVLVAYDASPSLAAFSASVFIIGTLVARLVSGSIMERIGRKRILLAGAALEIAFSCLYLLGTALPMLIAIRLAHGIAYGACSTSLTTIVTSMVPHERKGEGVGYYMLSVTLGAALGPSVGIFVSSHFDFDLLFIGAAITAVLALLGALSLKTPASAPSRDTLACVHADKQAGKCGRGGADANDAQAGSANDAQAGSANATCANTTCANAAADDAPASNARASWINALVEVSVLPISVVCGLVFFGYSSLLTFLTPYAADLGLTQAASLFFIVYALIMFVTRPFTGRTFDRRGPRSVMVPAFLSFALGMVMLGCTSNGWMLLTSALFLGFGVGTVQSSGLAMAVRATPDERLSLANSTFYICLDAGVGVGPLILGLLAPLVGYASLFFIMAAAALVALGLFLAVEQRR